MLLEESLRRDSLLYKIDEIGLPTLTRSFTALLLGHLVEVSNLPDSPYVQLLSKEAYQTICQKTYDYLAKEQDFTGYLQDHGWVHAVAHGADLLVALVCHPYFEQEDWEQIFPFLTAIFKRLPQRSVLWTMRNGAWRASSMRESNVDI